LPLFALVRAMATLADWLAVGSSNIKWCEFVVDPYAWGGNISEVRNTVSNVTFLVAAAVGLWNARRLQLPWAFVWTELWMIVVGFGSMAFHAYRNRAAEMADEIPMSVMAAFYFLCIAGSHWLTSPPYGRMVYPVVYMITAALWLAYLVTHVFQIFEACFTLQVLLTALVSLSAGYTLEVPKLNWWIFFLVILTAKGLWEYERYLFRNGACVGDALDWRSWLHPIWHLGSASAHAAWMAFAGQLAVAARSKKSA